MSEVSTKIIKKYDRYSRIYDLLEAPMELFFCKWRKELIERAKGKILEVGVGTGKNLGYYKKDAELTAIDFSRGMTNKAIKRWGNQRNIKFIQADIQRTKFADSTFDTVLASYVFCSIPNPVKGLDEIKRICRKNGKILLLEHVRSESKFWGFFMDKIDPLFRILFGYNINRNLSEIIKSSSLDGFIEFYLWRDILKMYIIRNK